MLYSDEKYHPFSFSESQTLPSKWRRCFPGDSFATLLFSISDILMKGEKLRKRRYRRCKTNENDKRMKMNKLKQKMTSKIISKL